MKPYCAIEQAEEIRQAATTKFPSPLALAPSELTNEEKIDFIAVRFREIMEVLGLDLSHPSLARTPYRVGKMYVNEIFSGLDLSQFPEVSFTENCFQGSDSTNMIFVKVNFHSFCEHHFVPMNGTAYIAYVPNKRLIGLSKIPRIVRFFARRPQLQERLTMQIADSLMTLLETTHVAVSLTAEHFCVMARGIQDEDSHMTTNALYGLFESDDGLKRDFFEAVNRKT